MTSARTLSAVAAGSPVRIAVTGATGLIGSALLPALRAQGHDVQRITRGLRDAQPGDIRWDPDAGVLRPSDVEGVDVFIHLAGESVAKRWTATHRRSVLESRTRGTRLLAETIAQLNRKPSLMVSASAVGFYGTHADAPVDESAGSGSDFLADVVKQWEAAAQPARDAGIRVVHPRIGLVLSRHGGALERMLPFFRLGLGGRLGSGRQWMSWISMRDLVRAIQHIIASDALVGAVNLVGPAPVQNREFTRTLGRVLHRPVIFPVPSFALRLVFGAMADGTILASQHVVPRKLVQSGFQFTHATLEAALRDVLQESAT